MRVSQLMQGDLETISPSTPLSELYLVLADSRLSALPVVNDDGHLVGVVSKTDILGFEEDAGSTQARETLYQATLAQDLMTSPALTIAPEATVRDAAQQMLSTGVHRLFVTAGNRPVGVISSTDILQAVAAGRALVP